MNFMKSIVRELFLGRGNIMVFGMSFAALWFGNGCATSLQEGGGLPSGPMRGVLLDAGHGGEPQEAAAYFGENYASLSKAARQGYREECYGAINASGYKEKTATLAVAKKAKSLLEQAGINTAMIRSKDIYIPLDERVAKVSSPEYRDWILVSIHFNRSSARQQATHLKARYRDVRGFEVYVLPPRGRRGSSGYPTVNNTRNANHLLAESVEARLDAIRGMKNRGIKEARFMILRGSPMPGVLIEGGFLSNPEEGVLIAADRYQEILARAIVDGIRDYQMRTSSFAGNAMAE